MLEFLKENKYMFIAIFTISFTINTIGLFAIDYFFECDKTEILPIKTENLKVVENTKTPPDRSGGGKRPPSLPILLPIQRPDGPPPRPPIKEGEPHMIIDGQKLFMIEDLNGRLRWVQEGQEKNFKTHQIAKQNFDYNNFDSKEFNHEWTSKMQESVFQEIQNRDDNLFGDISIDNVDCRADVGCRIDAIALTSQGKHRLPKLAAELGNIGKPKNSLFYRTYHMDNTDRELGIMRIYISASIYD